MIHKENCLSIQNVLYICLLQFYTILVYRVVINSEFGVDFIAGIYLHENDIAANNTVVSIISCSCHLPIINLLTAEQSVVRFIKFELLNLEQ